MKLTRNKPNSYISPTKPHIYHAARSLAKISISCINSNTPLRVGITAAMYRGPYFTSRCPALWPVTACMASIKNNCFTKTRSKFRRNRVLGYFMRFFDATCRKLSCDNMPREIYLCTYKTRNCVIGKSKRNVFFLLNTFCCLNH